MADKTVDKIIGASIDSLRNDGLKFSVDTLAEKLKISKKTIYKYFPDKQALAVALYEKYYNDAEKEATELAEIDSRDSHIKLLYIYYDSKIMTRGDIFNKYKLNRPLYAFTSEQNDRLWQIVQNTFKAQETAADKKAKKIITDGALEKLCGEQQSAASVIERLADILW